MRKYIAFLAMIPVCSSDVCSKLVLATIDEKVFAGTAVVTLIAGGSIGILRDMHDTLVLSGLLGCR